MSELVSFMMSEEVYLKKLGEVTPLINLNDLEIKALYDKWYENDCTIVGLYEILLYQNIREEIAIEGDVYQGEYDNIVLRYGQPSPMKRLLELSLKKNSEPLTVKEGKEYKKLLKNYHVTEQTEVATG